VTRGDESAARDLLGRASVLWGRDPPAELLYDQALATRYVDTALGEALFAETAEVARREGNVRIEWRARAEQAYAHAQSVSGVDAIPETKEVARRAIAVLEEAGDPIGCAAAWTLLAECHNSVGAYAEMLAAAETAADLARRAGDERAEYFANRMVNSAVTWGPTPVRDSLARARRMLEEAGTSLLRRATAMRALSGALAQTGAPAEAREWSLRSLRLFRELGNPLALATVGFVDGQNELLAGEPGRAETILRGSCEALESM